jgi:hypothetical protein
MAQRLWEKHFSATDRASLGNDFQRAYADGGPFQMWRKVHRVDELRALVEVGRRIGGLSRADYGWVCNEFDLATNDSSSSSSSTSPLRPNWNRNEMTLLWAGEVIRRIQRPNRARNLLLVLDAFQDLAWPARINDPLPGPKDAQRLHKTIQSLNRNLLRIRFHSDGGGAGISWAPLMAE